MNLGAGRAILHPFFPQNLPEGYLLNIIREEFKALLDGAVCPCWQLLGAANQAIITVTPRVANPAWTWSLRSRTDGGRTPPGISHRWCAAMPMHRFRAWCPSSSHRRRTPDEALGPLGKPTLRTSRHIIKGNPDDKHAVPRLQQSSGMRVLERLNVGCRYCTTRIRR